jgi:hypothetical protein
MRNNVNVKVIAFYLPQFHQIEENDRWWGKGFTDWVNVRNARPLFPEHNQPRVPLNNNYYDLTDKNVLKWQAEIAKEYGVHGLCHYHYWFEGKQLLEKPTNLFLESKEIDLPFCLAWANHTWSRAWDIDEKKKNVIQLQTHEPNIEKWQQHFDYLIKIWKDERAIKIDGKPVFIIFWPQIIDKIDAMLKYWKDKAISHGLKGLYFIAMVQFDSLKKYFLKPFDAVLLFQPAVAMYVPDRKDPRLSKIRMARYFRSLPTWTRTFLKQINKQLPSKIRFHDYDRLWEKIVNQEFTLNKETFPGAFVDWDNTARYRERARIIRGADPDRFSYWFSQLVGKVKHRPPDRRFIFINAWNEWAEGAYLEPDEKYRYQYLEAIKTAIEK